MAATTIDSGGVTLAADDDGEGTPVVLLHGLTATRRYVVMGSRSLERSGHRVVAYDARGHGESAPAPLPDAYGYDVLADDLEAVLDELGIERAVFAGASMGAHTIARARALAPRPRRGGRVHHAGVRARARRGPGRLGPARRGPAHAAGSRGSCRPTTSPASRRRGTTPSCASSASAWRSTSTSTRSPTPCSAVPRSQPFDVARRPRPHRLPVGRRRQRRRGRSGPSVRRGRALGRGARRCAELRTEEPGKSPLAWQGGQLSKVIADLAGSVRPAA